MASLPPDIPPDFLGPEGLEAALGITPEEPAEELLKPTRGKLVRTVQDTGSEEDEVMSFVTPRISEEKWAELENYLCFIVRQSIADRSELDRELKIYNDLYEGDVPEDKVQPWEGCANINVPLIQEMLDGLHSRLAKSSLGVNPVILVKGQDAAGVDAEYKIERYYETLSSAIDVPEAISQAVFLGLRDGVGLLKPMWDRRTRRVKSRKLKPLLDENQEPIINPETGKPEVQEVVEIDDLVEFDNVRLVPVELKDFYLLPAHAYDITRLYAKGVAERYWLRYDDMKQRGKSGMFKMEKVMALKNSSSQASRTDTEPEHQDHMGVVAFGEYEGFQEYELFDIYMNYDLDGDDYEEECVFTISLTHNVLLRAEVFPYWHQLRPYIPVTPWPRPRRFYGFSVPQRLESVQRELNAMHNQRLDAVSLRLSPPLFVKRSATHRGDASQAWGPGAKFEVTEHDDIQIPQIPDINPSSFTEETILRQYAERIIGLYDINTPRGTGARRTQAEIGAIQQEGMVRFDYMMKLIQRAIVKTYEQIHQLKIQYMPDVEEFEAVGLDGIQKFAITRQEMLANIKFVANGDLPVQDKERNRQEAYFLYQAMLANPLTVNNMERIYHVSKKLLQAWEDKSPEKSIGTLEEARQQQQQLMLQQQMQAAQGGGRPQGGASGGQQGSQPPRRGGASS